MAIPLHHMIPLPILLAEGPCSIRAMKAPRISDKPCLLISKSQSVPGQYNSKWHSAPHHHIHPPTTVEEYDGQDNTEATRTIGSLLTQALSPLCADPPYQNHSSPPSHHNQLYNSCREPDGGQEVTLTIRSPAPNSDRNPLTILARRPELRKTETKRKIYSTNKDF